MFVYTPFKNTVVGHRRVAWAKGLFFIALKPLLLFSVPTGRDQVFSVLCTAPPPYLG